VFGNWRSRQMMRLIRIVICTIPPPLARAPGVQCADDRYYEGGVSSVYMWDLDDGIAGVVLFKKSMFGS